jgi:hypothetical protein
MSISADLWTPGAPIAAATTTVLVRDIDVPEFRNAVASSGHTPYAFGIATNAVAWETLVAAYVRSCNPLPPFNSSEFFAERPGSRELFVHAARLSTGLREQNAQQVIDASDDLEVVVQRLGSVPSGLPKVIAFFRSLGRECLAQFEYSSPLEHATGGDTRKSWWNTQVPLSMAFGRMRRNLQQEFGAVPGNLAPVDAWLAKVEAGLRRIQASPPQHSTIKRSLVEASAYCCGLAERYLLRAQIGRAVLLLHRSADLLLVERCANFGAVEFTVPGGRYNQSMGPAGRIHLMESLNLLEGMNLLAPSPNRNPDLNELNDWRNLLAETHYMTSPSEEPVLRLFKRVRLHLEALGGIDWIDARDTYVRGLEIPPSSILDPEGVLGTSVSLVDPFP